MRPAKSDTDPGEDASAENAPSSDPEGPEYASIPPRWGSESEVTTVYDPTLVPPPAPAEHGLDELVARAQQTKQPPPLSVVFDILGQACDQLAEWTARPKGPADEVLAHGRLSPRRILLSDDGYVRIDWNVDPDETGTDGSSPVGDFPGSSPDNDYRSPEQWRGLPIDARSDVFSLALSVCELLVLKKLASDKDKVLAGPGVIDLASALREGKQIPRELGRVILRCFAKQTEHRYPDTGVLLGVLHETADKIGLLADRAATARYVRSLFGDDHLASTIHDTTLLPPPPAALAPLHDVDTSRELEDPSDDSDDELSEDDGPLPDWGNLDVFADISKPPSISPPAWVNPSPPARRERPAAAAAPTRAPVPVPAPAVAAPIRPVGPLPAPSHPPAAPAPASRGKLARPGERGSALPSAPPPLVAPPPKRGRGLGASPEGAAKVVLAESEPPSALTRSLLPLSVRLPLPGAGRSGVKIPLNPKVIAALGAVLLVVLGIMLFSSKSGTVVVAAAGNLGQPLGSVTVIADGTKMCEGSRCAFQLPAGLHELDVRADGYVSQERLLVVRSGEQSAVEFRLERSVSWLKMAARQDGTEVYVDDELAGILPNQMPQTIEVASGPHRIRTAAKHFAPEEQRVDLAPGETRFLGGIALRPIVGKASFDLRTPGAELSLFSDTGVQQRVDPTQSIDLDLSKRWTVEARRDGYATWRSTLDWNGNMEKTFVVALEKATPEPRAQPAAPRPPPRPAPAVAEAIAAAAGAGAPAAAAPAAADDPYGPAPRAEVPAGVCSVSFNSIPVSSVFLDGSRIGTTPQLRVSARPGNHTVDFVNGDAKRRKTFRCGAGEAKVVAINFGT